ncbi:hypothetical protein ACFZCP_42440 [Streptomyces sp. NPDC007971]|uniref:hypothetical protein n=1 Tax=Streptomyces sp. NPDC007971 TaxID=3364799 RepID=UPI0036E6437C
MPIFPDLKSDLLGPDSALQQAFDNALAAAPPGLSNVPLGIVALNDSAPHGFAGHLESEIHFSASLLKATSMWASFELLRAANELVTEKQPQPADVIPLLHSEFDDIINDVRVTQLTGVNLTGFILPRWDQIFTVQADSTVTFSTNFQTSLTGSIAEGDDVATGVVVHGVGFGYLTEGASTAGFFDESATSTPRTADGMWLCGDYSNGFPPQRIPCVNDTPTAQGTSVRQMARLFTFLAGNAPLVDGPSDAAMLDLLTKAVERRHTFLDRDPTVQFSMLQSKIGLGSVHSGTPSEQAVASEAAIVQEKSTGSRFVLVFQNRPFANDASVKPVSQVFDTAIAAFLFP